MLYVYVLVSVFVLVVVLLNEPLTLPGKNPAVNVAGSTGADPPFAVAAADTADGSVQIPACVVVTFEVRAFASSPRMSDMIMTVDSKTAATIEPNITTANCTI